MGGWPWDDALAPWSPPDPGAGPLFSRRSLRPGVPPRGVPSGVRKGAVRASEARDPEIERNEGSCEWLRPRVEPCTGLGRDPDGDPEDDAPRSRDPRSRLRRHRPWPITSGAGELDRPRGGKGPEPRPGPRQLTVVGATFAEGDEGRDIRGVIGAASRAETGQV